MFSGFLPPELGPARILSMLSISRDISSPAPLELEKKVAQYRGRIGATVALERALESSLFRSETDAWKC